MPTTKTGAEDTRALDTLKITLPSGRPCEIREMTGRDEKILTDRAFVLNGTCLNKMLSAVVVSLDGEPMPKDAGKREELILDMLTGDRNYLILQVRMLSYGDEMIFNWKCPKCGATAGYKLNLRELLDDGTLKVHPYRDDMPLVVETRQGPAEVQYMTGRSEAWLLQQYKKGREFDTLTLAMAACSSLNGKRPSRADMEELPVRDIAAIRKAASELKGGMEGAVELDCLKCGESNSVELSSIPDFFIPWVTTGKTGA